MAKILSNADKHERFFRRLFYGGMAVVALVVAVGICLIRWYR